MLFIEGSGILLRKVLSKDDMNPHNCPVVLHDHLDGSRTLLPVLPRLYELSGKPLPFGPNVDVHEGFKKIFADPQVNLVQKFFHTTGVMQTRKTLILAAEAYVIGRARQGFKYCEATIAPQYHTADGLSVPDVIDALIDGIIKGEKQYPEIEVNLIPSVGREVSPEEAVRLVNMFSVCRMDFCPGIGLVCVEPGNPPEKHIQMFKQAKKLGFKTTCHAGEWVSESPDFKKDLPQILKNIRTAVLELESDRIGHAMGLAYDPELTDIVAKRKVGIEGCPGSNLTSGLVESVGQLGIRELLQCGILYSLNPDDDLFMPDLIEVMRMCNDFYCFSETERKLLTHNAWISRFGNRKEHSF